MKKQTNPEKVNLGCYRGGGTGGDGGVGGGAGEWGKKRARDMQDHTHTASTHRQPAGVYRCYITRGGKGPHFTASNHSDKNTPLYFHVSNASPLCEDFLFVTCVCIYSTSCLVFL